MPIDNHPLTHRRLHFIGIGVNKLTLKSINIIQSSNNYNIVRHFFQRKFATFLSISLNVSFDVQNNHCNELLLRYQKNNFQMPTLIRIPESTIVLINLVRLHIFIW